VTSTVLTRATKIRHTAARLAELRDDPVGFCREFLSFDPHAGQARWLVESMQPGRDQCALTTGNRYGKSDIAAAKRIFKCVYKKDWNAAQAARMAQKRGTYQSLNVAPTADQAALVFHKAYAMLQGAKASWLVRDMKMTPFPEITFVNGAVLQARSTAGDGRHLLGHDYDDVNWDEAAYEPHFLRILENVLLMRLVDRAGKLDCTTTGNGKNEYGEYFLGGLPGAKAIPGAGKMVADYSQSGSTRENPHVDQKRVEALAARMSDRMRAQNIDGQIVEGGGSFFELSDIAACEDTSLNEYMLVTRDEEEQHATAEVMADARHSWIESYPSHRYMHGWDLADKQDYTVGVTWDLSTEPYTMVEFERFRRRGWAYVLERIRRRDKRYGSRNATKIDSTGLGDVVESELQDIGVEGVQFGGRGKKDALLAALQSTLSLRAVKMPFLPVVHNELAFYEREDESLVTDCVMSLAVVNWFAKRSPDVYEDISFF
jgi:phage terminase large subunit-like protein